MTAKFSSTLTGNRIRRNLSYPVIPPLKQYHTIICQRCLERSFITSPSIFNKRPRLCTIEGKISVPTKRPARNALSSRRPFSTSHSRLHATTSPDSPDPTTPSIPWPTHPNPTPYEIFALPRTATQKEIKSRYFHLVKKYHPDHAPRTSVDRFRKVVDAYKILSHPGKRHDWDRAHPPRDSSVMASGEPRGPAASEFRRPWSGSRLSRRRTEQKGPPPSGGWSFHRSAGRVGINHDYSGSSQDADNPHFSYEKHYQRNLEQEMKIKRRMDELRAHRLEFERQQAQNHQTARIGLAFTGGLFLCIVMLARSLYPS